MLLLLLQPFPSKDSNFSKTFFFLKIYRDLHSFDLRTVAVPKLKSLKIFWTNLTSNTEVGVKKDGSGNCYLVKAIQDYKVV
jgi:hypothetical protein